MPLYIPPFGLWPTTCRQGELSITDNSQTLILHDDKAFGKP